MVKDIRGGQMEMNIGESTKMTRDGERESRKRREYSTETHLTEWTSPAGLNILWLMRRNDK